MNIKIRFFATMFVAIGFITCISSCAKDDEYLGNGNDIFATEKTGEGDDAIVLGEKMNDPYNMAFMSEAFQQLKAEGTELPFDVLEPTGLYVRVLAGSTAELDLLEADTNMTWFDFPLDYEIISNGTYYHDPTLPDSATWKYGVIPMNYSLPSSLQHELIYNVFIPDDYPEYEKYEEEFDRLEEISESLCGYEEEDDEKSLDTKASKWHPSATIEAWDSLVNGYIPLQGVKVTVRRFTKYRYGITNDNGYYYFNTKYRKKVNYGITWESGWWDIRYGWAQAYYNGPEQKSAWDLKISKGGKSIMYATIHRAAWNAYYGYFGDLQRPYLITGKMKIRYIHSSGGAHAQHCSFWNVFGAIADIRVWGINDGKPRATNEIYGTVIHELAHQSHQRYMLTIQFWQVSSFIKESWARCVQCILTSHHYQNDLGINYIHLDNVQNWSPQREGERGYQYTPIFIDLIDERNQNEENLSWCKDNVSGYTLEGIQNNILGTSYGMHSLRQTLKANLSDNTSEEQIDELIDNYEGFGF